MLAGADRKKHQWRSEGVILAGLHNVQVTANDCELQQLQLDAAEPLVPPFNSSCIERAVRSHPESMLVHGVIL